MDLFELILVLFQGFIVFEIKKALLLQHSQK